MNILILTFLSEVFFFGIVTSRKALIINTTKEIVVSFSMREPFVIRKNGMLEGLDISIINNFARKFQLNVKYMEQNLSLNKLSGDKACLEHFLNKADLQKIDIFIGALDTNFASSGKFIASRSYYHDALTWCVQMKQPIPSWKNLFFLCSDPLVYIFFTLMCVSVVFTGYFMQQYEDFQPKWDWFRLSLAGISPCFGFPSVYRPNIIPNRIFFVFALFGATLAYIVCNSILLLFMNIPLYENQIKQREEIVHKQFELVGDGFALQHLKQQNQIYPPKLLERFKTCGNLNECLRQLNHNSKLAVAISREHVRIKHFLPHHYCFKNVEIIHDYALKFLIQKDFPYVKELNRFIATASASGLIEKWHKGKNLRYTDVEHEHIANLKMSFMFIFMIMSVSFLMLCLERLVHKKTHQPNPSWSWLTIQMIIDPYRRFWLKTKYLNGHPAY